MIKFEILEFKFAIKGPKLARRGLEDKLIKHKIEGLLFYMHPSNDFGGREGDRFPLTTIKSCESFFY